MSVSQSQNDRGKKTEKTRTTAVPTPTRFEPPFIQFDADEPDERVNPYRGSERSVRPRFTIWEV